MFFSASRSVGEIGGRNNVNNHCLNFSMCGPGGQMIGVILRRCGVFATSLVFNQISPIHITSRFPSILRASGFQSSLRRIPSLLALLRLLLRMAVLICMPGRLLSEENLLPGEVNFQIPDQLVSLHIHKQLLSMT